MEKEEKEERLKRAEAKKKPHQEKMKKEIVRRTFRKLCQ